MRRCRVLVSLAASLGASACFLGPATAWAQSFVHPGLLHTQPELDRMKSRVDAGAQPWRSGWDRLVANSYSQTSYTQNPQREVCAGGGGCPNGETFMPLARDAAAAYQNALRYRISNDTRHADKAVAILNAWSSTLQTITGDSNAGLRAGLYGYQLAVAGELLRGYAGWAAADFTRFKDMLLTKFYPISSDFLRRHNNTCFDHYWANWDVANMATILAIGVLADDRAKFTEAVDYFKNGVGTGQVDRLVRNLYPGDRSGHFLGQGQEAGRDQGHATLVISLIGAFCKIAYDQGEDLFAYKDNKVLALAEYTAKYNLGEDVPWTNYTNCEGQAMTAVSASGRGTLRPAWELLYNHYARQKGLYTPYSQRFAEMLRPEGGGGDYGSNSGGFDQLGFGTLTFTQDVATPGTGGASGTGGTSGSAGRGGAGGTSGTGGRGGAGGTSGSGGRGGTGGASGSGGRGGVGGTSGAGGASGSGGSGGTGGAGGVAGAGGGGAGGSAVAGAGGGTSSGGAGAGGVAGGTDAGTAGAGASDPGMDSGCSCLVADRSRAPSGARIAFALLALAIAGLRRHRRR
jgi:hypothetical protein